LLPWQRRIFSFLVRNVGFIVNFMGIPPERLIVYLAYIKTDGRAAIAAGSEK
jgi:hypothetical protein